MERVRREATTKDGATAQHVMDYHRERDELTL